MCTQNCKPPYAYNLGSTCLNLTRDILNPDDSLLAICQQCSNQLVNEFLHFNCWNKEKFKKCFPQSSHTLFYLSSINLAICNFLSFYFPLCHFCIMENLEAIFYHPNSSSNTLTTLLFCFNLISLNLQGVILYFMYFCTLFFIKWHLKTVCSHQHLCFFWMSDLFTCCSFRICRFPNVITIPADWKSLPVIGKVSSILISLWVKSRSWEEAAYFS